MNPRRAPGNATLLTILLSLLPLPCAADAEYFQSFQDPLKGGGLGPAMITVPAGSFTMGDPHGDGLPDEIPLHKVTIDHEFAIGKYEITFDEYDRYTAATSQPLLAPYPQIADWGRGQRPVVGVKYFDAVAYCAWLSRQTGHRYRLPTEAEWDYAARAGTQTRYWWGDELQLDKANCYNCSSSGEESLRTTPVGSFPANPWGLHDTVGNVWEWTASLWTQNYTGEELHSATPEQVKILPNYLEQRQLALRGGAWNLLARFNRSSSRYYGVAQSHNNNLGFRVLREK